MAKKRARTKSGQFVADDPNTPENEAWVTPPVEESSNSFIKSPLKSSVVLVALRMDACKFD